MFLRRFLFALTTDCLRKNDCMNERRRFLKYTGLVAGGIATGLSGSAGPSKLSGQAVPSEPSGLQRSGPTGTPPPGPAGSHPAGPQIFNMCGYAAPKIDKVRIGFIGLGNRGSEAVPRINHIDGVDIRALCDIKPELVQQANNE